MTFRGSTLASPCRPTLSRRRCEPHGGSHIYPAWRRNFCRPPRQRLGTMKTRCVRPVEQRAEKHGCPELERREVSTSPRCQMRLPESNTFIPLELSTLARSTSPPLSLQWSVEHPAFQSGRRGDPSPPARSEEHT